MNFAPFSFLNQVVVPTGLPANPVFYYDPGNISSYPGSGSVIYDLSGNNYTASLNVSMSWTSGSTASWNTNGNNGVSITGSTLSQGLVSWSMWVAIKRGTAGSYDGFLLSRNGAGNANGLLAFSTSNRLDLLVNNGTEIVETSPGTMTLNAWNFYGAAVDNTTYTRIVYKSGSVNQFVSGSKSAGSSSFNNPFYLGEDPEAGQDRTMSGSIGPALFYNRKLSTTEITQINDYFKSRYGI